MHSTPHEDRTEVGPNRAHPKPNKTNRRSSQAKQQTKAKPKPVAKTPKPERNPKRKTPLAATPTTPSTILWMDEIRSHHEMKPWLKPLFAWHLEGESKHSFGFLRRCNAWMARNHPPHKSKKPADRGFPRVRPDPEAPRICEASMASMGASTTGCSNGLARGAPRFRTKSGAPK